MRDSIAKIFANYFRSKFPIRSATVILLTPPRKAARRWRLLAGIYLQHKKKETEVSLRLSNFVLLK